MLPTQDKSIYLLCLALAITTTLWIIKKYDRKMLSIRNNDQSILQINERMYAMSIAGKLYDYIQGCKQIFMIQ